MKNVFYFFSGPDPDDLLDSTYTDKDGYFELKGDTVEFTNIDPEIRIYHTCAMHIKVSTPIDDAPWYFKLKKFFIRINFTAL